MNNEAHYLPERGLWDLDACCPYFQTGACEHTEAGAGYVPSDEEEEAARIALKAELAELATRLPGLRKSPPPVDDDCF